jgi:hypothetical protein
MALSNVTERLQQERVESQQGGTNAYHIRETAQGIEELLALTIAGNKLFSDYFKQQKVEAGDRKENLDELKRGNKLAAKKGGKSGGASRAIAGLGAGSGGPLSKLVDARLAQLLLLPMIASLRNTLGLTRAGFKDFGKGLKTFAKSIPGAQKISDGFNKFTTGLNKAGKELLKFAGEGKAPKTRIAKTALKVPFLLRTLVGSVMATRKLNEANASAIKIASDFQKAQNLNKDRMKKSGVSIFGKQKFSSAAVTSLSSVKAYNEASNATKFLAQVKVAFGGLGKSVKEATKKAGGKSGLIGFIGKGLGFTGKVLGGLFKFIAKYNPIGLVVFGLMDAVTGIFNRFKKMDGEDMAGGKGVVKKALAFIFGAVEGVTVGIFGFLGDMLLLLPKKIFGFLIGIFNKDIGDAVSNFSFSGFIKSIFDRFFEGLFLTIDIIQAGFKPLMKQTFADIKVKMAKIVALPGALFSATLAAIKAAPRGLAHASGVFRDTLKGSIDNNEGVKTATLNYLSAQRETGEAVAGAITARLKLKEEAELAKKNAESADELAEAAKNLSDATGGVIVSDSSTSNSGNTTINNSGSSGGGGGSTPLPNAWDTFDRNSGWGFS